ncbi:hypothetical protein LZ554_006573 [Drepanopeziza brunnea f. sp. 'monogermtubi']|nr:hypothetical protein LZ554_006573 [Drepanopeziza brunnea f. sp. 'monogermtubi']
MERIMNAILDSYNNNSEDEMPKLEPLGEQAVRAVATAEAAVAGAKDQDEETQSKATEDTKPEIKADKPVKHKTKKVVKNSKKGKMAEGSEEDVDPGAKSMLLDTPSKSGKRKVDSGDEQTEEDFGSAKKKSKKAVATPRKHNTRGVARKVKSTPKKPVYDSAEE